MEIYKGTLTLKKLTSKMVVYGNNDLSAQYVPKLMFKSRGQPPASLIFTLTIPDTGRGAQNQPGQHQTSVSVGDCIALVGAFMG